MTEEIVLLHKITVNDFYEKLRTIIKEELKIVMQQDQLLTKEGALKILGITNATFLKAVNAGIVTPQLVKGRKKAMYLESEVMKIQPSKRRS